MPPYKPPPPTAEPYVTCRLKSVRACKRSYDEGPVTDIGLVFTREGIGDLQLAIPLEDAEQIEQAILEFRVRQAQGLYQGAKR